MLGLSHFPTTSETETLAIKSRDQDRDKMNLSALKSQDHGHNTADHCQRYLKTRLFG